MCCSDPFFTPGATSLELASRGGSWRAHVDGLLSWALRTRLAPGCERLGALRVLMGAAPDRFGGAFVDRLRFGWQRGTADTAGAVVPEAHPLLVRARVFLHGREGSPDRWTGRRNWSTGEVRPSAANVRDDGLDLHRRDLPLAALLGEGAELLGDQVGEGTLGAPMCRGPAGAFNTPDSRHRLHKGALREIRSQHVHPHPDEPGRFHRKRP
jgi:hypothetical protein